MNGLSAFLFITIFAFLILVYVLWLHSRTETARADHYQTLLYEQQTYHDRYLYEMETASRIRHDVRNQLQTAYALMSQGEDERAKSILDDLSGILDREKPYCINPVINSILSVKAEEYQKSNVAFRFDCSSLPGELPFNGITLCSLFSNVLDNALNAAKCCEAGCRYVYLSCTVTHGFLLLTCQNPRNINAPESQDKKELRPGRIHGYGLKILEEIAQTYNGTMEASPDGDIFRTRVLLQLPDEKPVSVSEWRH